jgi:hypothetical protein
MSVIGMVTVPRIAMLSRITGKEKPPEPGGSVLPGGALQRAVGARGELREQRAALADAGARAEAQARLR